MKMRNDDVGADGSIAKEMDRGARALSYQLFATLPIVALTVLSEKNGFAVGAAYSQEVSFSSPK